MKTIACNQQPEWVDLNRVCRQDLFVFFEKIVVQCLYLKIESGFVCLKDAYLLHKWNKIQSTLQTVDWKEDIKERKYTDVDTLAAAACAGGACEIDF